MGVIYQDVLLKVSMGSSHKRKSILIKFVQIAAVSEINNLNQPISQNGRLGYSDASEG